jgi:hypothetical protein
LGILRRQSVVVTELKNESPLKVLIADPLSQDSWLGGGSSQLQLRGSSEHYALILAAELREAIARVAAKLRRSVH